MNQEISLLAQQILFYSILVSIVTYGLMMTLRSVLAKPKQDPNEVVLSKWVGVLVTYIMGILCSFILNDNQVWWKIFVFGLSIGSCSVAIYKSAVQSFLNLIPAVFDKMFKKEEEKKAPSEPPQQ